MRKILRFTLSLMAMLALALNADAGEMFKSSPAPSDYTLTYDKVSTLLKLTKEGTTNYEPTNAGGCSLEGYSGDFTLAPADSDFDLVSDCIGTYISLPDGNYTLHVQAGTFKFDGVENEELSIPLTVGTPGGGGTHEFEGTPYHETLFKAGETTVDKNNIKFETEGVTITTVDGEFNLGGSKTTIPFGYNTYGEKELDWNKNCKLVITAKKDINKVILVPTATGKGNIGNATAEGGDGAYKDGVWEGKLATGETLTLTSTSGTQIKEIYVCYNGDEFDPAAGSDDKGVITIQYPVENQSIEKLTDGGKFCTFTTNKEYAQVTIEIKNSNETYDNLYKFPTRMVDNAGERSDGLRVGENTVTAATPSSQTSGTNMRGDDWYFFKGDSYTMIVKGFVNMWDVMPDNYDAIAEVHFVGNGKEHAIESIVKLLNVTPATSFESLGKIDIKEGVVTLEFDKPVKKVNALTPGGQMDPTIYYTAAPLDGSADKLWQFPLGDRSGYASADTEGNPIIEIDVTAEAEDGVVVFSNDRADRGLVLMYELIDGIEPTDVVTLGTPTWSVAEGAEIEASTTSINIKFPNANGANGTYTLEVSGTLGDKNQNLVPVSGTGTMADGANITVSLSEDKGYTLMINKITVKNGTEVVYSTENGNFQLNFGTKSGQGGGTGDNILGEATFTAGTTGITVAWPDANFDGTQADFIAFGEWTLTHKGVNYTYYPDAIETDLSQTSIEVVIPYEKIAVYDPNIGDFGTYIPVELAVGDEITVTISVEAINVYEGNNPAIYSNANAISGTVTVPGTDSINNVNANLNANGKMYNLAGLQVKNTKGIVIISNKKVIK